MKINYLRSDHGGEFVYEKFKIFCEVNRIRRQLIVPNTIDISSDGVVARDCVLMRCDHVVIENTCSQIKINIKLT